MTDLWDRVDALVDRGGPVELLCAHGLHLLAARRWRSRGIEIPASVARAEERAAVRAAATPVVLERITAAVADGVVVMKGPAVAELYRDPATRPYGDIDVLVSDADSAQNALLGAGFVELVDPAPYAEKYHRAPVALAPFPLAVEVHAAPKWPVGLPPPTDLLAVAEPAGWGIDGILTLPREHHAVVLAAHSWAHEPLGRALDLLDVSVMVEGLSAASVAATARAYGVGRLWATTVAAADALLGGRLPIGASRMWGASVWELRGRTTLERHVERVVSDFSAYPVRTAVARTPRRVRREIEPRPGETWRQRAEQIVAALQAPHRPSTRDRSDVGAAPDRPTGDA